MAHTPTLDPPDWADDVPPPQDEWLPSDGADEDFFNSSTVPDPSGDPSSSGGFGAAVPLRVVAGDAVAEPKTPVERSVAALIKKQAPLAQGWKIGGAALDGLERIRALPPMPMPARWHEFRRLVRVYPGEILSVVAPTGAGKTSWALAIAMEFAASTKGIVNWLPRELDALQVDIRIAAQVMGIPWAEVREKGDPDAVRRAHPMRDRLAYAPRAPALEPQIAALAHGLRESRKAAGGATPLLVVDTVQLLANAGRDRRASIADAIEMLRSLTIAEDCYTILVSQSSRAGQAALRGGLDYEDARDAAGLGAETAELENASAAMIGLQVMPRDPETGINDAIALLAKLRNGEDGGRVGMAFDGRRGGRWTELDYVPETKVQAERTLSRLRKQDPDATQADALRMSRDMQREKAWSRKWPRIVAVLQENPRSLSALEEAGLGNRAVLKKMLEAKRAEGIVDFESAGRRWFLTSQERLI